MSTMTTDILSVNEAAEILGCTDGRVRQLLSAGTLRGRKLNERAWAIPRKEVARVAKKKFTTGRPRISKKPS